MADVHSRGGERYATPEIIATLDELHARHDPPLEEAFAAPSRADMPAIMLGPSEAKLLGMLLTLIDARRVVEIGTLAGYSAIRLARALPATGKLWTIEAEPRHAEVARESIGAAGLADRVEVLVADALDVLPTLTEQGPFDAVFLDADKERYDRYVDWALENLRVGGLVIADNAYYFGHLLDDSDGGKAMRRFHDRLSQACDSVCVPTPDGLALGIKRPPRSD
jgi:caffeoyl-CoA O-methyltransferase